MDPSGPPRARVPRRRRPAPVRIRPHGRIATDGLGDGRGRDRLRAIGALEVLGAIGVVLPGLTGVLPWLVPIAAASLVLLMLSAAIFHLRRPGEVANVGVNAALGILGLVVAIGRFVVAPL